MTIPLARPDISDVERARVQSVLETSTLSQGSQLEEFESRLAKVGGVRHAVAVNSGTSALHLALAISDIGPGDEVITTPFSFIASANCILFQRARPVFADIDPNTLCIDPSQVQAKITDKTKAIVGVDVFGQPADWNALQDIASEHDLLLVEDAAEAVGSTYDGRPAGSFGDRAIFAFYPNKQITTGEGGALLTNDAKAAGRARSLRNQGRRLKSAWLEHEVLGYNYRLDELSCALGNAQLDRLDELLEKRRRVFDLYQQTLSEIDEIVLPEAPSRTNTQWFVYVIRLKTHYSRAQRNALVEFLKRSDIQCGLYFPCIHLSKFYRSAFGFKRGTFPIAEAVSDLTIALPFHTQVTQEEVFQVADALREGLVGISRMNNSRRGWRRANAS